MIPAGRPRGAPVLDVRGIGKSFGGVPVLRDVSFSLEAGRILGLLGEDGAGKSTLMNVVGGVLVPERGQMRLGGAEYRPRTPGEARRRGVAFVHQPPALFPHLTVAENVFLAQLPRRRLSPFLDRGRLASRTREVLASVGLSVSPWTRVAALAAGERQLVEIARAVAADARVVILDEPTTFLESAEITRLAGLLGGLRAEGRALIYVSRIIPDPLRLADDLLVLRDGAVVASGLATEFDEVSLVGHVARRAGGTLSPHSGRIAEGAALEVAGGARSGRDPERRSRGPRRGVGGDRLVPTPWLTLGLLLLVMAAFSLLSPRLLEVAHLVDVVVQAASLGIVATGMTFVLLTGGIDLSVGSLMLVSAALVSRLVFAGWSWPAALAVAVLAGLGGGSLNGLAVSRLGIPPFVVTLCTLTLGRGVAQWLAEGRTLEGPDSPVVALASVRVIGVPVPLVVLGVVLVASHLALQRTAPGRDLYAVGEDAAAARQVGLPVKGLLLAAYVTCGLLAAVGGALAAAQPGAVSPTPGGGRGLAAIAAALLGGVSLSGGRGGVLPGVLLGALLMQTVESGLVTLDAPPDLTPMVVATLLFGAALLDRLRVHRGPARGGR